MLGLLPRAYCRDLRFFLQNKTMPTKTPQTVTIDLSLAPIIVEALRSYWGQLDSVRTYGSAGFCENADRVRDTLVTFQRAVNRARGEE